MRTKRRIQPYVRPDTFERLRLFAAATGLGESIVVDQALRDYLNRDGIERDLVIRRLDRNTLAINELRHDIHALAEAWAVLTRAWLSTATPPTNPDAAKAGRRRGEEALKLLVASAAERYGSGPTFIPQLRGRHYTAPE